MPPGYIPSWCRTSTYAVTRTRLRFKRTQSRLLSRIVTSSPLLRLVSCPLFFLRSSLDIVSGSGKTAAYLIPTISKLMGKVKKLAGRRPNLANGYNPEIDSVRAEPLILVVAPTRELCTQIFDEARRLCYRSMLRPCVAYGGAPKREQQDELQRGCDILIATPGRLLDFMSMARVLSLCRVRSATSLLNIRYPPCCMLTYHSYTIIDEADELISPDWEEDIGRIMSGGGIQN